MSLPSLLLVDDSDAILALERAILSGHYTLHMANNGREALEKVGKVQPAAVLLDLSMPEMDGDEVLKRLKADPATEPIPVVIISSEVQRAEACLALGAEMFVAKPFKADELLAAVESALARARQRARTGAMALLRVGVANVEMAVPLEGVRQVLLQPSTRPLVLGPEYLSEYFELRGEPVFVLDVARRLGLAHQVPLEERKLVVLEVEGQVLALSVDSVQDPEEYAAADIERRDKIGGAEHGGLREGLLGMLRAGGHAVPIIDPKVLIARELFDRLPSLLGQPEAGQVA